MRMRRTTIALTLLALLAVGCREDPDPAAGPATTPVETTPAPNELEGASCEPQTGGSDQNLPDFVEVIPSREEGIDRVTFRFEPEDETVTEAPSYSVQFVDELVTDGEGAPVDVEGEAFVAISFHALGVDLSEETPREIYTGPTEFKTGFANLLEIEQLGDFEAVVSWGMGLQRESCFRVESSPTEITIEFPSP